MVKWLRRCREHILPSQIIALAIGLYNSLHTMVQAMIKSSLKISAYTIGVSLHYLVRYLPHFGTFLLRPHVRILTDRDYRGPAYPAGCVCVCLYCGWTTKRIKFVFGASEDRHRRQVLYTRWGPGSAHVWETTALEKWKFQPMPMNSAYVSYFVKQCAIDQDSCVRVYCRSVLHLLVRVIYNALQSHASVPTWQRCRILMLMLILMNSFYLRANFVT